MAAGKGVLLLASLRQEIGTETFDKLMDEFGTAHAGTGNEHGRIPRLRRKKPRADRSTRFSRRGLTVPRTPVI